MTTAHVTCPYCLAGVAGKAGASGPCPSCGRALRLPADLGPTTLDLSGVPTTLHEPTETVWQGEEPPVHAPEPEPEAPPRHHRGAWLVLGAALACPGLLWLAVALSRPDKETGPRPVAPNRPASQEKAYPYPECRLVVDWLSKNVGSPESIQIVAWRREPFKDITIVHVKYRGKNNRGGWSVERRQFSISGDKINWTQVWPGTWEWND